jgi:flagellar hook assembly protein FlgD
MLLGKLDLQIAGSPGAAMRIGCLIPASSKKSDVRVTLYDLNGRVAAVLAQGAQASGRYTLAFNGRMANGKKLVNGIYLCKLQANSQVVTRRLILLR